ncbi:hypothetical protein DFH06DRAFT_1249586 [Mycena polygramma]|nr:hypothetical protein DFH06DRAFT_1249586 [Mycena polygramma]
MKLDTPSPSHAFRLLLLSPCSGSGCEWSLRHGRPLFYLQLSYIFSIPVLNNATCAARFDLEDENRNPTKCSRTTYMINRASDAEKQHHPGFVLPVLTPQVLIHFSLRIGIIVTQHNSSLFQTSIIEREGEPVRGTRLAWSHGSGKFNIGITA